VRPLAQGPSTADRCAWSLIAHSRRDQRPLPPGFGTGSLARGSRSVDRLPLVLGRCAGASVLLELDGDDPATPPEPGQGGWGRLVVRDVAEVIATVDAAGPPSWLVAGLWPADAYGVLAAESKAGKTWAILDLAVAVAVATGRPWLGRFACPERPALVFLGEGGERATIRRLRAVCAQKGLDPAELAGRLRLCFRVPKLLAGEDLQTVEHELAAFSAGLVVIDPLYLAAAGAQAASLFQMGAALEPIQAVCQHAGGAGGGPPLQPDRPGHRRHQDERRRHGRMGPRPRRHLRPPAHHRARLAGQRRAA
jgi:hypothetical protein